MSTSLDLPALRAELIRVGAFERRTLATSAKLALLLGAAAAAIALPLVFAPWLCWALLPATALLITSAVMIGHEGGHKSFASRPLWNEILLHLVFPLIGGLSAAYWKDKHNANHHGHPNIEGVDEDLDVWPMASSRRAYEGSGMFRRWFQRNLQRWMFWPLTSFLPLSMRYSSVRFLVRRARRRHIDAAWSMDAVCLALHYTLWLVLPALGWGLLPALGFYLSLWGIVGILLSGIFAPAHMGLPMYRSHPDTWRLQLETTRNLKMPRWLRFFFVGLDHQVEHHLFMRIPHQNLPRAAAVVRAWARHNGAPYQEIGFFRAIAEVTRFMGTAWRVDAVSMAAVRSGPPVARETDRGFRGSVVPQLVQEVRS